MTALFLWLRHSPAWQPILVFFLFFIAAAVRFTRNKAIAKSASNILAIIGLVATVLFVTLFAENREGETGLKTNQITSTFGNNSPITSVTQSSNVTVNNNSGTFTLSISGDNNGIAINGYNNHLTFITNIIYLIQSAAINSTTSPEWSVFTNQLLIALNSYRNCEYTNTFQHANLAIQILETSSFDSAACPLGLRSAIYTLASISLDELENDPLLGNEALANKYAQRAFEIQPSEVTKSVYAMTLNNLSGENIKSGNYSNSLILSKKAIGMYKSMENRINFDLWMPAGAASLLYRRAANSAFKLGKFDEAEEYAFNAARIEPSTNNVILLVMILSRQGFLPTAGVGSNSFRIYLIKPPAPQIYVLNSNNEIVIYTNRNYEF